MTDGLAELRENVAQLREHRAAQEEALGNLADDVKALTEAVASLKTTIDRSRGALYVISGVSGAIGIIASGIVEFIWKSK